jgi:putative sterol carrier protein
MATAAELFATKIPETIATKTDLAKEVNATYQFDLSGDGGGKYFIALPADGTPSAGEGEKADAAVTISLAAQDFVDMLTGAKNAQVLFMSGKLKVKGQMGLALKLQRVLA